VVNLRNNNLQERHWDEIHSLLGFEIKGDKNFTLGDLVNEGVTAHADQITVIATNATQESVLEEMMAKVRDSVSVLRRRRASGSGSERYWRSGPSADAWAH
jgi:hypothetical protein